MADALVSIPQENNDTATCRASEITLLKWERGHSYTILHVHLSCGEVFHIRDYNCNAYEIEKTLKAAMKAALEP